MGIACCPFGRQIARMHIGHDEFGPHIKQMLKMLYRLLKQPQGFNTSSIANVGAEEGRFIPCQADGGLQLATDGQHARPSMWQPHRQRRKAPAATNRLHRTGNTAND